MRPHHQLPVRSPLPLRALVLGARTLLAGGQKARERLLALVLERTHARQGLLTDSGTSAMRLALELLREAGHVPVALPGFSCYDVASAAVGAGVPVHLYDIDRDTLSPDLESLSAALSAGVRSVVVAPLYGYPVDWDGVRDLTRQRGIPVVEDAAQAHGSHWRGNPPGSHGDLAVLSFGRGKGWSGGGGGALVARSAVWSERLEARKPALAAPGFSQEIRHLATTSLLWILARPSIYGLPRAIPALGLGETRYRHPHPPFGMTAVGAAIALATADPSDREVAFRKRAGEGYEAGLAPGPPGGPGPRAARALPGGASGYLRFPVRVGRLGDAGSVDLPERLRRMGAERSYPETLGELEALGPFRPNPTPPLPGATVLARTLITLPTHSGTEAAARARLVSELLGANDKAGPTEGTKTTGTRR